MPISNNKICKKCGKSVIIEYEYTEDYDVYYKCSNKDCEHNLGQGTFLCTPVWVEEVD